MVIAFTNMAQKYLRLHHLQYRFLKISGGGPPTPFQSPSRFTRRAAILSLETYLWVDMYVITFIYIITGGTPLLTSTHKTVLALGPSSVQ